MVMNKSLTRLSQNILQQRRRTINDMWVILRYGFQFGRLQASES